MENTPEKIRSTENGEAENVAYNLEKDFYTGTLGELRLKAEGLFKKAKEKGISIDDVQVITLKEGSADFPGIGTVDLPTFIAKVRGRLLKTGQVITDGKQIDYYNRYQKYLSKKIEQKNIVRDEQGKIQWENGKPKIKNNPDLFLTEWERFEIGKALVEDKEFGLEKTITGACDRVIRKLMGENDWIFPGEAVLLDEEFEEVQERIQANNQERRERPSAQSVRKASEKQISFLKSKIKNAALNPDDGNVLRVILDELGFKDKNMEDLSMGEMSQAIDKIYQVVPRVKEIIGKTIQ